MRFGSMVSTPRDCKKRQEKACHGLPLHAVKSFQGINQLRDNNWQNDEDDLSLVSLFHQTARLARHRRRFAGKEPDQDIRVHELALPGHNSG
jgi:hypothetical protein